MTEFRCSLCDKKLDEESQYTHKCPKRKVQNMKNFIFKSTDADLQKMFQLLETIQKNGLYCTYRIDSLLKNFEKLLTDKGLQKQVDEFFENEETSPQTDPDEQQLAYGQIIRQGLRIAGRIDRKYNINKIFVQKYVPPGYRKSVNKVFDVVGALGGGYGLYKTIQSLSAPDTPGNDAIQTILRKRNQTRTPYKTRIRQTGRYRTCRCKQYKSNYRQRRTRFG